jgi:hypothetical protein
MRVVGLDAVVKARPRRRWVYHVKKRGFVDTRTYHW